MEWIAAIIGLSGMMFILYSIPLIKRTADLWRLREDYRTLPAIPIRDLKKSSGVRKVKGTAEKDGGPLFSMFDDTSGLFFRTKFYPASRKNFTKSWQSKIGTGFKIKDKDGGTLFVDKETAESPFGRFIIFHREISGGLMRFCKRDRLPDFWRENLENACATEEYLGEGRSVTVIGMFKSENGRTSLKASLESPFVISECSDEAFLLLHLRFFSKLAFLSASMLLTGLLQLYMLFFVMMPGWEQWAGK